MKKAKAYGMVCPKNLLISANQRRKFRLRFGQSAAPIQMMSHHLSKPCENLPYPSDFHDTHLAPVTFRFNCTVQSVYMFLPRLSTRVLRL